MKNALLTILDDIHMDTLHLFINIYWFIYQYIFIYKWQIINFFVIFFLKASSHIFFLI